MKQLAQQIVEFIIANSYPEAKSTSFDEYCFLAGLFSNLMLVSWNYEGKPCSH